MTTVVKHLPANALAPHFSFGFRYVLWPTVTALVSSSAVGSVVCVHPFSRSFSNIGRSVGSRYFTVLSQKEGNTEGSNPRYLSKQDKEIERQKHYIKMHLPSLVQQNSMSYEMRVKIEDGTIPLFIAYSLVKNKVDAVEANSRRGKGGLTQIVEETVASNSHKQKSPQNNLQEESIKYRQASFHENSRFQHVPATTGDQGLVDKISNSDSRTEVDADRQRKNKVPKPISSRDSKKLLSGNATADIAFSSANHPAGVAIPPKENSKILRSDDPIQIYLRFCLEDVGTVDDVYRATLNAITPIPQKQRPMIQQSFHFVPKQSHVPAFRKNGHIVSQTIHTATSTKDWIKYPANLEEITKASCMALWGQNWTVFNDKVIYFQQKILGKNRQIISQMLAQIPQTSRAVLKLRASLSSYSVYSFTKGFLGGLTSVSGNPNAPDKVKLDVFVSKTPPHAVKNDEKPAVYQRFSHVEPQQLSILTRQMLVAISRAPLPSTKGDNYMTVEQSINMNDESTK